MKQTMAHKRPLKRTRPSLNRTYCLPQLGSYILLVVSHLMIVKKYFYKYQNIYLNKMFCLVEQPEGGVPGAVSPHRDEVLQVLQTTPQVSAPILFQLIVSRSEM